MSGQPRGATVSAPYFAATPARAGRLDGCYGKHAEAEMGMVTVLNMIFAA